MKKILVVASLLCLFACQHKQENKVESVDANTLVIDSLTNLPEQKIKEIRYIPLETNDDILIGGISTVRYVNGYFYFISSQKILVFDKRGKFAYCIDKVGQGPGEYTSAWGVDVNLQGDVYVADTSVGKVIKYSSKGTQFEEYMIGERMLDFAALNDSVFYLANILKGGESDIDIALARYSTISKELKVLSTYDDIFDDGIQRFGSSFFRSNGSLYYYKLFSSELCEVTENGIKSYLKFPSTRWATKDIIKKWQKNMQAAYKEDKDVLRGISAFCETGEYLYIDLSSFPSVAILKNKKTGELTKPNFFSGKIRSYQQVNGATDNYLVFLTSSESENIEYILEHDTDMLPEDREALSHLSDDDNPVLMLLKF